MCWVVGCLECLVVDLAFSCLINVFLPHALLSVSSCSLFVPLQLNGSVYLDWIFNVSCFSDVTAWFRLNRCVQMRAWTPQDSCLLESVFVCTNEPCRYYFLSSSCLSRMDRFSRTRTQNQAFQFEMTTAACCLLDSPMS